MYKVMVVDDETAIRKGLVNFIKWDALECSIAGEAENGRDAAEKIGKILPDIVITDIKMPGMNGIELSKYIYTRYPNIKVILLTGFADFSYAQASIRYGVADFVLKPTSKDKITDAVNRAKEQIALQREKDSAFRALEDKVRVKLPEMQERFLWDVVSGVAVEEEGISQELTELNIILSDFYALTFEIDRIDLPKSALPYEKTESILLSLRNVLSLAFKDYTHYILVADQKLVCVLLNTTSGNETECMQAMLNSCDEVLHTVNTFMDYSISAGISALHHTGGEIRTAFEEAKKALAYKYYCENRVSVFLSQTEADNTYNLFTDTFIDRIIDEIDAGCTDQAAADVNLFFEQQKKAMLPMEHIKNISIQLCSLCSRLLGDHNAKLVDVVEDGEKLYEKILQSRAAGSLAGILASVVKAVSLYINLPNKPENYIVRKSLEYIQQYYNKSISLQNVADDVHVNSSYLSRLFRKETGETITEAIIRFRLEKAKELLADPRIKAYEIAYIVGIEDPAYFSQTFKKYVGLSPKEYRKKVLV